MSEDKNYVAEMEEALTEIARQLDEKYGTDKLTTSIDPVSSVLHDFLDEYPEDPLAQSALPLLKNLYLHQEFMASDLVRIENFLGIRDQEEENVSVE